MNGQQTILSIMKHKTGFMYFEQLDEWCVTKYIHSSDAICSFYGAQTFRDNQSVVKVMNKKESEETAFWIFWCTQSSHKRNIKTLLSTRRGQVFCQNLSVPSRQQEIQMAAASAANVVSSTWLGGGDACSYSTWDLATEVTGLHTHRHTHVSMHTHTHISQFYGLGLFCS